MKMFKMSADLSDFWSVFSGHCHSGVARVSLVDRYATQSQIVTSHSESRVVLMLMWSCLNIKCVNETF